MQQPEKRHYTYADYLTWNDGNRYELIDGDVFMMSPAPSPTHQRVSGALFVQLYSYLKGTTCEVYPAPFDVRLAAEGADDTVVQPDISVICDPGKLDDRGCNGAPDMVVEILSPSTAGRDQVLKFERYRRAGVREYWVVHPQSRVVQVYLLADGEYIGHAYDDTAVVPVHVLDDCQIQLADVFPPREPEVVRSPEGVVGP